MFNQIIANVAGTVREETLEGRPHLVAPVAMLAEGVWPGSKGPVFYPWDQVIRNEAGWDHKPVVMYHPSLNGKPVSACDPEVLNNQSVGRLLRTKGTSGKLRSEAWLDIARLEVVEKGPEVLANLRTGTPVEVSTGLGADLVEESGIWNMTSYGLKAVNYVPDHLALLPDRVGAYSLADGGGLLVTNELSFSATECAVRKAIAGKVGKPGEYWDGWIEDVFPDRVVYWYDGNLYQIGYRVSATDQVTLEGEPKPVVRVTEYRAMDGKMVGNARGTFLSNSERCHVDKKAKVDKIIANGIGWTEDDRPTLMGMDDKALDRQLTFKAPAPAPAPVTNQEKKVEPPVPSPSATPAPTGRVLTAEEEAILNETLAERKVVQAKMVSEVVANSGGLYTAPELEGMPFQQLRKLHLATAPKAPANPASVFPNPVIGGTAYLGAGGAAEPLRNQGESKVEPLQFGKLEFNAGK